MVHSFATSMALQHLLVLFHGVTNVRMRDVPGYTVTSIDSKNGSTLLLCAVILNAQMVVIVNSINQTPKDFVFAQDLGPDQNVKTQIQVFVGMNTKKRSLLASLLLTVKSRDLRTVRRTRFESNDSKTA